MDGWTGHAMFTRLRAAAARHGADATFNCCSELKHDVELCIYARGVAERCDISLGDITLRLVIGFHAVVSGDEAVNELAHEMESGPRGARLTVDPFAWDPSKKIHAAVACARMFFMRGTDIDAAVAEINAATRHAAFTSDGYEWADDEEMMSSIAVAVAWMSRDADINAAARRLVAAGGRGGGLHTTELKEWTKNKRLKSAAGAIRAVTSVQEKVKESVERWAQLPTHAHREDWIQGVRMDGPQGGRDAIEASTRPLFPVSHHRCVFVSFKRL